MFLIQKIASDQAGDRWTSPVGRRSQSYEKGGLNREWPVREGGGVTPKFIGMYETVASNGLSHGGGIDKGVNGGKWVTKWVANRGQILTKKKNQKKHTFLGLRYNIYNKFKWNSRTSRKKFCL